MSEGVPIWIDLGTTDVTGAVEFYTHLFGWTHVDFGSEAGGYGAFLLGGKQVAGVGPATDPSRGTSWATYLATEDVDAAAQRVRQAGGEVILEPMQVMDQGRMAVFRDTTGAYFNVWESGKHTGAEVFNVPGAFTWAELMTDDSDAAKAFYSNAFGLSARDTDAGDGGVYILLEAQGKPVAGMMQHRPQWGPMPTYWSIYFTVADLDASADKAVELGGMEMVREDSPAGRFAQVRDPQGGTFGMIRNDPAFSK